MDQICEVCGKTILMQIFKDSGVCSDLCHKVRWIYTSRARTESWQTRGENDILLTLSFDVDSNELVLISYPALVELLKALKFTKAS